MPFVVGLIVLLVCLFAWHMHVTAPVRIVEAFVNYCSRADYDAALRLCDSTSIEMLPGSTGKSVGIRVVKGPPIASVSFEDVARIEVPLRLDGDWKACVKRNWIGLDQVDCGIGIIFRIQKGRITHVQQKL